MKHRLRFAFEFARLFTKACRGIPDYLLGRMQEFINREHTIQTLEAVTGDKGETRIWLWATRGDAEAALEAAQAGLELETAIDWREQGFGPDSIRQMARTLAVTPAKDNQ